MMKNTVFDILEELERTPSRLAKEAILQENASNDLLRRTFIAAQDPYTVYYVNKFKAPQPKTDVGARDSTLELFLNNVLMNLSSREWTGNKAKSEVNAFLMTCSAIEQKWCQRILLRNLRVGVQESTVNKTWEDAIKSFSVSLAETLKTKHDKKRGIRIVDPVYYLVRVEPKLDGLRCVAVKQAGQITMYTRNGSVLETLPSIVRSLEKMPDDTVLDGEAMGSNWNESASVLMSKKDKKDDSNIVYNVFDVLALDEWLSQKCETKLTERLSLAQAIIDVIDQPNVKTVPGRTVENDAELLAYYSECLDAGYEGIMLKDLGAPYLFKRSRAVLKMKPVATYEGVIVGHYDGRKGTKHEGIFGGFYVVLPNAVVTKVGGGFNDKLRVEFQVVGRDNYLGKIIECECQPDPATVDGLTKDGKMRFPVFIRFRDPSDVDPKVINAGVEFLSRENDSLEV